MVPIFQITTPSIVFGHLVPVVPDAKSLPSKMGLLIANLPVREPSMGIEYKRHKKFPFRPDRAALLVVDVQNYFTNKDSHACIPSAGKIIPRIDKLVRTFHKFDRLIIFTRHIDVDMNNLMNRWWQDSIIESKWESELNSQLDISLGRTIIKHQYDAFWNTDLDEILRKEKIEQVVVTGVVAHLCCETTARSAFMRDFETFFVTDATASYDPEHHKATIFNLAHGFAVPVKTEVLLNIF